MTLEVKARKAIDAKLQQSGWPIQDMKQLNLFAGKGVAVREFPTSSGPVDYIFWIKDKSLADLDSLPDPDVLAMDIIENLQSALEGFQELRNQLAE